MHGAGMGSLFDAIFVAVLEVSLSSAKQRLPFFCFPKFLHEHKTLSSLGCQFSFPSSLTKEYQPNHTQTAFSFPHNLLTF